MPEENRLMPHQRLGVDKIKAAPTGGFLLAYEMGCGKTATAITALAELVAQRTLVVCPLAVAPHWEREIRKWWPRNLPMPLVCNLTEGHKLKRLERFRAAQRESAQAGVPMVALVNYDVLNCTHKDWKKQKTFIPEAFNKGLLEYKPDVIIADEVHRVKEPRGIQSLSIHALGGKWRIGLSGTPMPHSPLDAFGVMRFIESGVFGLYITPFRTRYGVPKPDPRMAPSHATPLGLKEIPEKMAPHVHDVKASEVLTLPEYTDYTVPVTLEPATMKAYKSFERDLIVEIGGGEMTAANALVKMLRLQQLTGGVVTPDGETGERVSREKADALADVLEDVPMNEPVVVFCRFTADLAAVREVAAKLERPYMELSGQHRELDAWQTARGGEILGVQIQAGSEGVDFTRSRVCIYYSLGYSLRDYKQSRARLHRPGQTRNVSYFHLVASGTVDVKVMAALEKREEILESVMADMRKHERIAV